MLVEIIEGGLLIEEFELLDVVCDLMNLKIINAIWLNQDELKPKLFLFMKKSLENAEPLNLYKLSPLIQQTMEFVNSYNVDIVDVGEKSDDIRKKSTKK